MQGQGGGVVEHWIESSQILNLKVARYCKVHCPTLQCPTFGTECITVCKELCAKYDIAAVPNIWYVSKSYTLVHCSLEDGLRVER